MTAFIYPNTLRQLARAETGWESDGLLLASFVTNYPLDYDPRVFALPPASYPPQSHGPPTSAADDLRRGNSGIGLYDYWSVEVEVTGRTVIDGRCYSDPLVWSAYDSAFDDLWWTSTVPVGVPYTPPPPGWAGSIWPTEVAAVQVYGLVFLWGRSPLFYTDEVPGLSGISFNKYPTDPFYDAHNDADLQTITLDPGGEPWFELES